MNNLVNWFTKTGSGPCKALVLLPVVSIACAKEMKEMCVKRGYVLIKRVCLTTDEYGIHA